MTLAEVIVDTAIETKEYLIDIDAILMDAAKKCCLQHFEYLLDEQSFESFMILLETVISQGNVDSFAFLAQGYEADFDIGLIADNDEMVRVALETECFCKDKTFELLEILTKRERYDLIEGYFDRSYGNIPCMMFDLSVTAHSEGYNKLSDIIRKISISTLMKVANKEIQVDKKKVIESNMIDEIDKIPVLRTHDLNLLNYACKVSSDETVKFITGLRKYPLLYLLFAKNGRLEVMKWFHERGIKIPEECKEVTENKEVLDWLNSL